MEQIQLKKCLDCLEEKFLSEFHKRSGGIAGAQDICKLCKKNRDTKRRDKRNQNAKIYKEKNRNSSYHVKLFLLKGARSRAKTFNRKFDLTIEDIGELPEYCPVFPHLKLESNKGKVRDNSYTLDRINSNEGYVKGNIQIISHRANTLKSDRTLEEQEMLVKYMREQRKIRQQKLLEEIDKLPSE